MILKLAISLLELTARLILMAGFIVGAVQHRPYLFAFALGMLILYGLDDIAKAVRKRGDA